MTMIDIIIVNWNAEKQLSNCLKSISGLNGDGFKLNRMVVVDNALTDNSINGLENLALPLEIIRNNENIGFAAACNKGERNSKSNYLLFLNPDTKLFFSRYMTEWNHKENKIVDQIMGAYFLVRHSLFKQLGGFDERFFVYFEDVDFSLRAYKVDLKSAFLSESKVYHKGGGISEQIKAKR